MTSGVKLVAISLVSGALLIGGCSKETTDNGNGDGGGQAQAPAPAVVVPAGLFTTSAPADAKPLIEVKPDAKPGDAIVFEARVGGRVDPFIENRAVFFVTDASILSCDQLHGDACKTPWDYCCEPKDNLLRHMATVQIVGDDGQPLKLSLSDEHGLAPLKTICVTGTVDQADASGTLVVNAESIHVKES